VDLAGCASMAQSGQNRTSLDTQTHAWMLKVSRRARTGREWTITEWGKTNPTSA
jgi:hypothetical protein